MSFEHLSIKAPKYKATKYRFFLIRCNFPSISSVNPVNAVGFQAK